MWRIDSLEKNSDAGKDWRQEEKGMTGDEMIGWHHWLNGYEFEQTQGDSKDREAWRAAEQGVTESWTWLSDWTTVQILALIILGKLRTSNGFWIIWNFSLFKHRDYGTTCSQMGKLPFNWYEEKTMEERTLRCLQGGEAMSFPISFSLSHVQLLLLPLFPYLGCLSEVKSIPDYSNLCKFTKNN